MTSTVKVTDATLDAELAGSKPIVVNFWATWCGPCRMLAPILEEIAGENAEKFKIGKVNVDENPRLAMRYRVMGVPTTIVFRNGVEVTRVVGAKPKAALLADLTPHIG
ncbi:thioredoxin 1 [Saccharopolyspora antimicrobica]|uniref:Thioredoxin n=1 Tax=Saccharopolyspora antimicrobica TaxID=455193 RepID=A0A1I5FNJ3_9PSEU|nr:thioredoxin [Saccharopolyspora antimicrobica]RKT82241.1 thioredoxin [Saccharopolyspora antimicrobica]SFO25193.1 thioredoxin 1 [Saccharopolyspora antimicrobica]